MKSDEIRSHRLQLLYNVYIQSEMNDLAVINRAMLMGVSTPTAKSYLKAIKIRAMK